MNKKITYLSEEADRSGSLEKIKKELKECQKEKEEYLAQAQRARADLINYRRRQEILLEELRKFGQEAFLKEILPVLDSLRLGSKENEGIRQIKEQLEIILKRYGLTEIKVLGQKFNPIFHEAVEQIKSQKGEGTVIQEVQKGYLLGDKVLRVSKVKIAK
ncbi:MAG: nucleotide exchange factor GrpE [Candidatus Portnoybacteria bacterium CG03_land_8_20_14_0_80_41_10]|uniref:Protein GrpE n=1 Tax=Candidatus Portnoybacteria bacterium CG03_land_8_20_14_0_80_41_10 TaxID=1974808 RepID=A0A2M7BVA4_9BACT|nr:MAG: nucleotide exchange factor GrpE [Candidatus Portnoybacteria bacterium CG03_land_8_20_14_0_80_41_10]